MLTDSLPGETAAPAPRVLPAQAGDPRLSRRAAGATRGDSAAHAATRGRGAGRRGAPRGAGQRYPSPGQPAVTGVFASSVTAVHLQTAADKRLSCVTRLERNRQTTPAPRRPSAEVHLTPRPERPSAAEKPPIYPHSQLPHPGRRFPLPRWRQRRPAARGRGASEERGRLGRLTPCWAAWRRQRGPPRGGEQAR